MYQRGDDLDMVIRRAHMSEANFMFYLQGLKNLGGIDRIMDELRRRRELKDRGTIMSEIYGDDPLVQR